MSGFTYKASNAIGYYIIDEFEDTGKVKTCFSTRSGGVSKGTFSYLNLGYKSGDKKTNIDNNIAVLCKASGFKVEDMVLSDQVHGDQYSVMGSIDRGKGTVIESDICGIDALITNEKGVALCIFTADCVPVFILDKANNSIALCHAGWRGVINEIVPKTVSAMTEIYGTEPHNIIAAIGPSIGPCCFNVGIDVMEKFKNAFNDNKDIIIEESGKHRINLWNALAEQLRKIGLDTQNIIDSKMCTSCNGNKFYSYRRDGSSTGRMISIVQLV